MIDVTQDKFITDYVTTWMATWGAEQYRLHGKEARGMTAPVEDAIHMGRIAWATLLRYGLISPFGGRR